MGIRWKKFSAKFPMHVFSLKLKFLQGHEVIFAMKNMLLLFESSVTLL